MNLSRHKRALKDTLEDLKIVLATGMLLVFLILLVFLVVLPIILYDCIPGSVVVAILELLTYFYSINYLKEK
jgi:multidrug efflux pump subunit AcrB